MKRSVGQSLDITRRVDLGRGKRKQKRVRELGTEPKGTVAEGCHIDTAIGNKPLKSI